MKRFQVHLRIGKQAIKIVSIKCNDIFKADTWQIID